MLLSSEKCCNLKSTAYKELYCSFFLDQLLYWHLTMANLSSCSLPLSSEGLQGQERALDIQRDKLRRAFYLLWIIVFSMLQKTCSWHGCNGLVMHQHHCQPWWQLCCVDHNGGGIGMLSCLPWCVQVAKIVDHFLCSLSLWQGGKWHGEEFLFSKHYRKHYNITIY